MTHRKSKKKKKKRNISSNGVACREMAWRNGVTVHAITGVAWRENCTAGGLENKGWHQHQHRVATSGMLARQRHIAMPA